jgi:hypothetical protein
MITYEYSGGCHCHDIRFNLKLQKPIESNAITACNCSICEKTGFIHLIIAKAQFQLLTDWNKLSNYQFNKKIAKHYFCKQCGIKSFYQPRSHPDCWSVNVRCLDDYSGLNLQIDFFDGKNWQKNIGQIT